MVLDEAYLNHIYNIPQAGVLPPAYGNSAFPSELYPANGLAFAISQIFANGAGFYSDLTTGLYQDSAGTTPISAYGQGIGLVVRQAGTFNMGQPSDSERPVLGRMPIAGIRNQLKNSAMVGAVSGSPGTLPTGWSYGGAGLGTLSPEVVSVGVDENGNERIRLRFSGTASTSTLAIAFSGNTDVEAETGQEWTTSAYVRLAAGTLNNILGIRHEVVERTAAGASVTTKAGPSLPIDSQNTRYSYSPTLSGGGTVAAAQPRLTLVLNSGNPVDVTLDIAVPQMEREGQATGVQQVYSVFNITERGVADAPLLGFDLSNDSLVSVPYSAPPPVLGMDLDHDYFVDATTGSDSNDGLSEGSAWKSLSKISSIPLPAGGVASVLVKAGTYDTAIDYVLRQDAVGIPGEGSILTIVYEPGVVMDGTAANAISPRGAHEFGGTATWTCIVYGNGLVVQNYSEGTGASPNGFGNRGTNTLHVYNAHCDNCDDGFSAHDSAQMYVYDSSAVNAEKAAFHHINDSYTEHHRCTFELSSDVGGVSNTAVAKFFDCVIEPEDTTQRILYVSGSEFERCQIGNLDSRVVLTSLNAESSFSDCYVNTYADGNSFVSMAKCYGKLSLRVRAGGSMDIQNCVFSSPSTGSSYIFFSNSAIGCGDVVFSNNIIVSSAFTSFDSTNAAAVVAAEAQLFNNCLSGGAAYDSELVSADTSGTVIVGTVEADPGIGDADTTRMMDYGFLAGSPAAGAGVGGIDIGFYINDAVPLTLPAGTATLFAGGDAGLYFDEFTHAGGDFTYGPTTWTGGDAGAIAEHVGSRLLMIGVISRALTEFEMTQISRFAQSLGVPVP